MKHLCLKTLALTVSAICATNALAATKNEPPLVDLGAEMKAKTDGVPKVTYEKREKTTPKPPKPEQKLEASSSAGEPKAQEKLAIEKKDNPHWSYRGETGPRFWGEMSSQFATCKEGKNQSPINLNDAKGVGTTNLPELSISYQDVPYRVTNNGHTLQVGYPLGSYIKVGEHRYELMQFHFHTPSEHQKEGFNYPMEVQMVHKDGQGNFAVMAVIFREGAFNETLQAVLDNQPKQIDKQQIFKNVVLNPVMFMPGNTEYYNYSGSLTTPPCSEGVYWMVFKHPVEASAEQLQQMNEIMGDNHRPVQPLNARNVLKSWADNSQLQEPPMYEYY